MRAIGVIGLGTMGFPMAVNLLNKGLEVIAYNRTSSKTKELVELGAAAADSPRDAVRDADVVITMLSDDATVEAVYYGPSGVFEGLRSGQIVIDCSTVSPSLSRRIADDMKRSGAEFLDAPVTGSKPAAESGTLLFIVGGTAEAIASVEGVLLAMGREVVHMGPSGAGSEAKLAHNAMVGIHAAALAEAMTIATKAGLDPEKFLGVVLGGGASSKQAEWKGGKIVSRDFSNQFSLKLMLKDLGLASDMSDALRVPSPMLASAKNLFRIGDNAGYGELDLCSVVQCYESWADVEVKGRGGSDASAAGVSDAARESGERRRAHRVPMNIKLHISVYQWEREGAFSGQQIEAKLFDLSENGLQIRTSFPLAADMFVIIHFPQDAELPPITGKIIRVVPDDGEFRYGCMLSGISPYVRKRLEEYVRSKFSE